MGLEALAGIGWVDVAGEHASETAEPQQDSGPTGCHLVGRAGKGLPGYLFFLPGLFVLSSVVFLGLKVMIM